MRPTPLTSDFLRTAGTVVGMLPITLEWTCGLERRNSLTVEAIGGLQGSTFRTLIYVPVFYDLFEQARTSLAQGRRRA